MTLYRLKPVTPDWPKNSIMSPPTTAPSTPKTTSPTIPWEALVFITTDANQPAMAPKIIHNNIPINYFHLLSFFNFLLEPFKTNLSNCSGLIRSITIKYPSDFFPFFFCRCRDGQKDCSFPDSLFIDSSSFLRHPKSDKSAQ